MDFEISKLRKLGKIEKVRKLIRQDKNVPKYHIYPYAGGYINDVNAFFKYKGVYHVFYQYSFNPDDTSLKEWVHEVSYDLVRWEYKGIPIKSDAPFDKEGAWSGNVFFDENGAPIIVYYAYNSGICLARPKDLEDCYLTEWVKDEKSPVISMPTESDGYKIYDVSNVWKENGKYYLLSGNKSIKTNRPTNYLFSSVDLYNWNCVGEFIDANNLEDKDDMACPNIVFYENGIAMLTFCSHYSGVQYYTGKFENEKFNVLSYGRFNYYGGNEMGQSQFKTDNYGESVYMSWLTDMRRGAELYRSGWSGVLTIPKLVCCDGFGKVTIRPYDTVYGLFKAPKTLKVGYVNGEKKLSVKGRSCRLKFSAQAVGSGRIGAKVYCGEGEETLVFFDANDNTVKIDYSASSITPSIHNKYMFEFRDFEYLGYQTSYKVEPENGQINFEIFLDNSVLEVYVNGISMSRRVYANKKSNGISLFADIGANFSNVSFAKYKG